MLLHDASVGGTTQNGNVTFQPHQKLPGPWCHLVRTFTKLQKIIHNLQCLAEEKNPALKVKNFFFDLKNVDHLVVDEN